MRNYFLSILGLLQRLHITLGVGEERNRYGISFLFPSLPLPYLMNPNSVWTTWATLIARLCTTIRSQELPFHCKNYPPATRYNNSQMKPLITEFSRDYFWLEINAFLYLAVRKYLNWKKWSWSYLVLLSLTVCDIYQECFDSGRSDSFSSYNRIICHSDEREMFYRSGREVCELFYLLDYLG